DSKASAVKLAIGEDVIAYPGHGQIRQDFFVIPQPFTRDGVTRGNDDVVERQHDALRTARGAGGIQNHGEIGAMPLRYVLVKIVRMLSIEAPALLLERSQGM